MSHTATLFLFNGQNYIETCEDLIEQLENQKTNLEKYNVEIDVGSTISKINKIKQTFSLNNKKMVEANVLADLSRLEKEVANIKMSLQKSIDNKVAELIFEKSFNYSEKIKSYGSMFYDVIQYLNNNNIAINDVEFDKALDKIRDEQIALNIRNEFINNSYAHIDSLQIPDVMKVLLKKEIRQIKTKQEMSDVFPMIESKIQEFKRFKKIISDFNQQLKNVGFFQAVNIQPTFSIDDYSNYVVKYEVRNASNNSIKIIMNSEGQIKYKLGNYVGHMCNKTAEQLLNLLREKGYVVDVVSIKRDIDNNKPLAFEQELSSNN